MRFVASSSPWFHKHFFSSLGFSARCDLYIFISIKNLISSTSNLIIWFLLARSRKLRNFARDLHSLPFGSFTAINRWPNKFSELLKPDLAIDFYLNAALSPLKGLFTFSRIQSRFLRSFVRFGSVSVSTMTVNRQLLKKYILPGYLTIFHVAFIVLLAFFSKYYHEAPTETNLYASE